MGLGFLLGLVGAVLLLGLLGGFGIFELVIAWVVLGVVFSALLRPVVHRRLATRQSG